MPVFIVGIVRDRSGIQCGVENQAAALTLDQHDVPAPDSGGGGRGGEAIVQHDRLAGDPVGFRHARMAAAGTARQASRFHWVK